MPRTALRRVYARRCRRRRKGHSIQIYSKQKLLPALSHSASRNQSKSRKNATAEMPPNDSSSSKVVRSVFFLHFACRLLSRLAENPSGSAQQAGSWLKKKHLALHRSKRIDARRRRRRRRQHHLCPQKGERAIKLFILSSERRRKISISNDINNWNRLCCMLLYACPVMRGVVFFLFLL